jgi:hypothetical protein
MSKYYDKMLELINSKTLKEKIKQPILLEKTKYSGEGGNRFLVIDKELAELYLIIFHKKVDNEWFPWITARYIRLLISLGLRFKVVYKGIDGKVYNSRYKTKKRLKILKKMGKLPNIPLYENV